jgi:hypothetical protein
LEIPPLITSSCFAGPRCLFRPVAVRLRPLHEDTDKPTAEKRKKSTDKRAWNIEKVGAFDTLTQKGHARRVEGRTVFHFDQVFDEDTKTPLLYKSIARPMVHTVLNGKHATIFAYGQTGSGKFEYSNAVFSRARLCAGVRAKIELSLTRRQRNGDYIK